MNRIAKNGRFLIWILTVAAVLAGCQFFSRGVGRTVEPERRLPIHEGGPHTGAWVGRDVVFSYEYVRRGDGMTVNGTVDFRGSINNFPIMLSFSLDAYYLDAGGQVIAVSRIYTAPMGRETGTWRFTRNLTIPPDAVGWAVGYSGSAKDYGYPGDAADWTFWDTPFK